MANTISLPLVNMQGKNVMFLNSYRKELVPVMNDYVNTPFNWMFPGKELIQIQLNSPDDIGCLVDYDGKTWFTDKACGMSIKKGIVTGMTEDLMSCIIKKHSDVIRFNRWALPNAWYGMKLIRPKVLALPKGAIYMGNPIGDGFSYFTKQLVYSVYNETDKIRLNKSKGSYTFWQWLPWSLDLQEEMWPYMVKRGSNLTELHTMVESSGMDYRNEMANIDPDMMRHPAFAFTIQRSYAEFLARSMFSIDVNAKMKIIVPSTADKVAMDTKGVITRFPVDSPASSQAVEACDDIREIERIRNLEVVQYSLSNFTCLDKGCAGVVEDLGGYDIVTCEDNLKMGVLPHKTQVALCLTQFHSKGTAIGVNEDWGAATIKNDFDGDPAQWIDCSDKPVLWQTVYDLPQIAGKKLTKVALPPTDDNRANFMSEAFSNVVGLASNQTADVLAYGDTEYIAECLGTTANDLIAEQTLKINIGTDFKADAQRHLLETQIKDENRERGEFIAQAPWPHWPDEWSFRHGLPPVADTSAVYSTEKKGKKYFYRRFWVNGEEIVNKDILKNVVAPEHNGTIGSIYRLMYPMAKDLNLEFQVPVLPLSHFKNYVRDVKQSYLDWAYKFQETYNDLISRLNFSDSTQFGTLKSILQQKAKYANFDEYEACKALWQVTTEKSGAYTSSYSVFATFPAESMRIVLEHQAWKKAQELCVEPTVTTVVISGVANQISDFKLWSGEIEVVDFEDKDNKTGQLMLRKSITAKVGQRTAPAPYPEFHLGTVIKNGFQPDPGKYTAMIQQISNGAWEVKLVTE